MSFRHGKRGLFQEDQNPAKLQWSHVFSDMVSPRRGRGNPARGGASMEPCLFRHGKSPTGSGPRRLQGASMEPCLFRHGKGRGAA